jgi:hypothetical protein
VLGRKRDDQFAIDRRQRARVLTRSGLPLTPDVQIKV